MSDLELMTRKERKQRIREDRVRAGIMGGAAAATLTAAGLKFAPRVAAGAAKTKVGRKAPERVKDAGRKAVKHKARLDAAANDTFLYGAVPGAVSSGLLARSTMADANTKSRRLRSDGSLRGGNQLKEKLEKSAPKPVKGLRPVTSTPRVNVAPVKKPRKTSVRSGSMSPGSYRRGGFSR